MKKLLYIIAVFTVSMCITTFARVVTSKNNKDYEKELNSQFATREEVMTWAKEMQRWFDFESEKNLLYMVASRSELHGYKSEAFYEELK